MPCTVRPSHTTAFSPAMPCGISSRHTKRPAAFTSVTVTGPADGRVNRTAGCDGRSDSALTTARASTEEPRAVGSSAAGETFATHSAHAFPLSAQPAQSQAWVVVEGSCAAAL